MSIEIERCRLSYRCEQRWESLEVLPADPRVRFCGKCQSAVHLVERPSEFDELTRQGKCVAVVHADRITGVGKPEMLRKIIFLDFDGVLHPDGVALFSLLPLFESYLAKMPEAEVVVSSTWREDHTLEELRQFFSPAFRCRISGVTPSLDRGYDLGGRQMEIRSYLTTESLDGNDCNWVALDDNALFFENSCPNLVLTDSSKGFTEQEGEKLVAWYNRTSIAGK